MAGLVDRGRRKELNEQYQQAPPEAGVYRILNRETGRFLLGSTTNLAGFRNRFEFARSNHSAGALDSKLRDDIAWFGFDAFRFEVLDTLEVKPEMAQEQIAADAAGLIALWREKFDPVLLY
ncbi:MAG: GIY-YIG nuclease family protein [Candidatus Dormibacteraeota bacterium]|nr:GIY-YIG nuclease family protein [Candidatus Dormibacteraeota bacterium]